MGRMACGRGRRAWALLRGIGRHVAMLLLTLAGFAVAADDAAASRAVVVSLALAAGWTLYLARERTYRRLQGQALTDPLTGLYNRRCLDDRLEAEMARARRTATPLSVAMLDLDDFKRFNDAHGHLAGDRALVALARAVSATLRRSDGAFRLGGEEFVLLLPGTSAGDAVRALERLRAAELPVTFSAGVVEYPKEATDGRALIHLADARLLWAKEAGKGRICANGAGQTGAQPGAAGCRPVRGNSLALAAEPGTPAAGHGSQGV